ncbi:hypothetical protein [Azotobacter salinestris]|uniref:hypothetical protein n=1 Tax=Azotobacter salinestris TaxID=69964 RepID=UPI0032DFA468
MSKRALIAKLKRIAAHDEQMQTIRQISDLIDELSAAAAGGIHQPGQSLDEILAESVTPPLHRGIHAQKPAR